MTRGKVHEYLGMKIDYSIKGKVKINMVNYVKKDMLANFPKDELQEKSITPANKNLFKINKHSPPLSNLKREEFHTMVAKGLFVAKKARQELQPAIAFLCTRVQQPTKEDWGKLARMMRYLNGTQDKCLVLEYNGNKKGEWYVNAAFAVHADYRSHSGATFSIGKGSITAFSTKQKLNTRSSTKAELVAIDDAMSQVIWSKLFLQHEGIDDIDMTVYQDNKSTMLLEENGHLSAGKRSRHLNICYFFVTDMIKKGMFQVKYCPTGNMIADFLQNQLKEERLRSSVS